MSPGQGKPLPCKLFLINYTCKHTQVQGVLTQKAMCTGRHTNVDTHSVHYKGISSLLCFAVLYCTVLYCFVVVRKLDVMASLALRQKRTAVVFVMEMGAPAK